MEFDCDLPKRIDLAASLGFEVGDLMVPGHDVVRGRVADCRGRMQEVVGSRQRASGTGACFSPLGSNVRKPPYC